MRTTGFLLVAMYALIWSSCGDPGNGRQVMLEGSWINVATKSDTLTFYRSGSQGSMTLRRGVENRDGASLPKYGSGSYAYKLVSDRKIALHWELAATASFRNYVFRQWGNQLQIENFYDTDGPEPLLTFVRIK